MFEKIAGYEDIKEELLRIRCWLTNKNNLKNPKVSLPKGIIFYGRPGNGKTLFLKEYSISFGAPVIIIEGNETNVCKEIHQAFEKAKQNELSIVLIDEIDLLISKNDGVERTLQSELDGINSSGNVLVLATTNSLRNLRGALLRSGRFDRTIEIENPDLNSRKELLDLYINQLEFHGEIDTKYLAKIMSGVNGADVKSILNDVYLRCGNQIETTDIEDSYHRIIYGDFTFCSSFDPEKADAEIAYHEVAHTLLIYKNRNHFSFYKASFGKGCKSGTTRYFPASDRDQESSDYCLKQIEVCIAGYVMTKLKFHRLDSGCLNDLQRSRDYAVRLVNKLGYSGPQNVLPFFSECERMETEKRKRDNEIAFENIIKHAERTVKKYLKRNMKKADALVKLMMKKGFINASDLELIINKKRNAFGTIITPLMNVTSSAGVLSHKSNSNN